MLYFVFLLPHLQAFCQKRGGYANTSTVEAAIFHNSNCDLQGMLWLELSSQNVTGYRVRLLQPNPKTSAQGGPDTGATHARVSSICVPVALVDFNTENP